MGYKIYKLSERPQSQWGLGDVVASIANPIAGAIDRVAGTRIKGCGGCKKRQEALNKMIPNVNPLASEDKPKGQ